MIRVHSEQFQRYARGAQVDENSTLDHTDTIELRTPKRSEILRRLPKSSRSNNSRSHRHHRSHFSFDFFVLPIPLTLLYLREFRTRFRSPQFASVLVTLRRKVTAMATTNQILANRKNSELSTGPRTPEGKAASSINAKSRGLTAADPVL